MPSQLTARRHRVEGTLADAIEFCFQQGWTDGLPVVPPTAELVGAMLGGARLDPKQYGKLAVLEVAPPPREKK